MMPLLRSSINLYKSYKVRILYLFLLYEKLSLILQFPHKVTMAPIFLLVDKILCLVINMNSP